jgi:hypothetical protein
MRHTLWKWFLFTVLVSFFPFMAVAIRLWSTEQPIHLQSLWPRGQLFLVSTALAAEAIGDLVTHPSSVPSTNKMVLTFFCVATLAVASVWYAFAQDRSDFNLTRTSNGSIILFLVTLLVCISAKAVTEESHESRYLNFRRYRS